MGLRVVWSFLVLALTLLGQVSTSRLTGTVQDSSGAVVAGATGSYRPAIISLVIFFFVGLVLMYFVPVRRAIQAVGNPEPAVL